MKIGRWPIVMQFGMWRQQGIVREYYMSFVWKKGDVRSGKRQISQQNKEINQEICIHQN
jgi:hypothetical protein